MEVPDLFLGQVERNAPRKSGASPSRAQSVQVEHDFKLARSATKAFSSAKPPQLSTNSFNKKMATHTLSTNSET